VLATVVSVPSAVVSVVVPAVVAVVSLVGGGAHAHTIMAKVTSTASFRDWLLKSMSVSPPRTVDNWSRPMV
jgi:hypothetical protein